MAHRHPPGCRELLAERADAGLHPDREGRQLSEGAHRRRRWRLEVWIVGIQDDTNWPDVFDGTDSAETATTRDILAACGRLAAQIATDATSNRTYPFDIGSLRGLYNGVLPKKFVVFVLHNTGVNLHATGGNHAVNVIGEYANVAA